MSLRGKLLFVGMAWSLVSVADGWPTFVSWPLVLGRQIFYYLGIPAFPPVYFYMLGVGLWSLLFFAVGALLDGVLERRDNEDKRDKRKKRLRAH